MSGARAEEVARLCAEVEQRASRLRELLAGDGETSGELALTAEIAFARDAQAELVRRERLFRAVFEEALDAMLIANDEGRYVDANPAACELLGVPLERLLTMRVSDFADPSADVAAWWATFLREKSGRGEFTLRLPDGSQRTAEFRATANILPGLHLSVLRDVTERRAAEATLAASERRLKNSEALFRALVEDGSDVITLCERSGRVIYASPALRHLLGYAPEEYVGLTALSLVHPEDVAVAERSFLDALAQPGELVRAEYRLRHKDGSYRTVETTRVNRLHDPELLAVVAHHRDISERAMLEAQVVQAQKMEAVGRLAGGIAHDFNNMLSVILSLSSMMASELEPDSPLLEDVREIARAAERSAALTQQLLAFSRKQVLQPKVIDVNTIVSDLGRMIPRVLGEDVRLVLDLGADLRAVKVDPHQLEQALLNLAINARDAMPGGGTLTLSTSEVELSPEYCRGQPELIPGPHVRIAVEDTGIGMSSEVIARLFEPFFTTKPPGKGTGLGLPMVFGIVHQSGGHIAVNSTPGLGSRFELFLPVTHDSAERPDSSREPPASRRLGVILVIEDDPLVRRVVERILRQAGHTVYSASTGFAGLELAAQVRQRVDLVLTDVIMPEMGGREVAERVQALLPGVRVLFMSGYTDQALAQQGILPESVQLIEKPISPSSLLDRVDELLARAR